MLTFKQIFPSVIEFKQFIKDFSFYYDTETYTEQKILIYYTILYRNFANSHTAFDIEVFNEMLSMTLAENFREFFIIRDLMNLVASKDIEDLLIGVETISNAAEAPNIETDKDTIVNYIGTQARSKSKENIIDRVYTLIPKIHIPEIKIECKKYEYLFIKIIPRFDYDFEEDEEDES